MTSNQVQYWKNVETERSNRARESETARHDKVQERQTDVSHELEAAKLRIEQGQLDETHFNNLIRLAQQYTENGYLGWSSMPTSMQNAILSNLGIDSTQFHNEAAQMGSLASSIWEEILNTFRAIGGGRGIGAMFF